MDRESSQNPRLIDVPLDFGDPLKEADCLRQRAGLLDLSYRDRLCLLGEDRRRFLNGQLTNNIRDLAIGSGCYALATNRKGIVEGDARIFCLDKGLLLELEPDPHNSFSQRLCKFMIADDVELIDVREDFKLLSIQGPLALSAIEFLPEIRDASLPASPFEITLFSQKTGEIYIANHPRTGTLGYDFFIDKNHFDEWKTMLKMAVMRIQGGLCGWTSLETLRIENGTPRYPDDMSPSILAPELGREDRCISYTKGCYIGQEIINRIKRIGKVTRRLSGLVLDTKDANMLARLPVFENEKQIGLATSFAFSEPLGRVIALAMLKMSANQIGNRLDIRDAEGSRSISAKVSKIPFLNF